MANRIESIFSELRARGGKALMPYVTVGDPDVATTGRLLPAMEQAGASICELGIPFSDPIADGPVIQASMTYALNRKVRVRDVLEMVASQRSQVKLGLIAMVSYSIVYRLGLEAFVEDARQAGIDGFIFPDLPVEESDAAVEAVRSAGLILSMLVSPATSDQRAERIAKACSGFVYVLSRAGITGERSDLPAELPGRLARLRNVTDLPMAVGFGISSAQQVRQVVRVADAAIVGSAIVKRVTAHREEGPERVVQAVSAFTSELAKGLESEVGSVR